MKFVRFEFKMSSRWVAKEGVAAAPFINTLRPRQNVHFFNENAWIPIKISLKFVPKGPISNIPALV